ncbi:hypothetical protein DXB08_28735 [Hungatella hathewayi]|uniref:hypothetical protein n=1 Tax=Hungatella hathewayi TaxID=154046 RepID=UPI000E4350B4|nr:hypothetical protein [Hungatella hathewayi]RGO65916.1 hypothetical protein DXB08_28735 [Hungatella hathewayi]
MIKANELREKTKEVYKKKIKEEIKVIEETCLSIALNEENGGLIYEALFDDISEGAQNVLKEHFYKITKVTDMGGFRYRVSWE